MIQPAGRHHATLPKVSMLCHRPRKCSLSGCSTATQLSGKGTGADSDSAAGAAAGAAGAGGGAAAAAASALHAGLCCFQAAF